MRDVNDTRYYMLLGRGDWGACQTAPDDPSSTLSTAWEATGADTAWQSISAALSLRGKVFTFPQPPADHPVELRDRRGADQDQYGNWYWIDESRNGLKVLSVGTGNTSQFWQSQAAPKPHRIDADFKPVATPTARALTLQGLAITREHYLVVGVLETPGLLIFDLHGPDDPIHQVWDVPFVPFDMQATPDGGLVILDREHRRYWRLNHHLQVCVEPAEPEDTVFQPKDRPDDGSQDRQRVPRSAAADQFEAAAIPVTEAGDPIAIDVLPDGGILILDAAQVDNLPGFHLYREGAHVGDRLSIEALRTAIEEARGEGSALTSLVAHDFALASPPPESTAEVLALLYLVGQEGNQSFAFYVIQTETGLSLQPRIVYLPMRLFGGKGLISSGTDIYYDFYERWIPLVAQSRPRYVDDAVFYTPIIDSQLPDCVWHRLMLDACIPPNTTIRVSSRAANETQALEALAFSDEPHPYRRGNGSELPFVSNPESFETHELLLQQANGRYLQLAITLRGDGVRSPLLRELRAYYPRFSYLNNYLPAVYGDNDDSARFIERFLANIEGFYTVLEGRIASVQGYFDPHSVPSDAVDWLASWFGIAFDSGWDEARKRFFIQHALRFFRMRGTVPGLVAALRLALDNCIDPTLFDNPLKNTSIRIVENFRKRMLPGVLVGDPTAESGITEIAIGTRWEPGQGREVLNQRYHDFLGISKPSVEFPLQTPENPEVASQWETFARRVLGFVPEQSFKIVLWHDFLARRYGTVSSLPAAYVRTDSTTYAAFSEVPWFTRLPADGPPLRDWYHFESVVLAMQRTAHRFTVLLAVDDKEFHDPARQEMRRELAERIIAVEKPAHTVFELRFYWGMFRIGEVRLGDDTVLDRGSRNPMLMSPLILGRGFTLDNTLSAAHPDTVEDRFISNRDSLQ
jgi:phage tail-like protein